MRDTIRVRVVTVSANFDLLFSKKEVMNSDKPDSITHSLEALSVFRGIYKRVAVLLDVDPSYVSRVARGERNAPFVTDALRKEIQRVMGKAGLHDGDGNNHDHHNGTAPALLDGHSLDGNHHNGHARNLQPRNGHSPDGHSSSLDGHHAPSRAKKSKTSTKKSPARKRKS
jgi:hypothetical protein